MKQKPGNSYQTLCMAGIFAHAIHMIMQSKQGESLISSIYLCYKYKIYTVVMLIRGENKQNRQQVKFHAHKNLLKNTESGHNGCSAGRLSTLLLMLQLTDLAPLHNLNKQIPQRLLSLPNLVTVLSRTDHRGYPSGPAFSVVYSHCSQIRLLSHFKSAAWLQN